MTKHILLTSKSWVEQLSNSKRKNTYYNRHKNKKRIAQRGSSRPRKYFKALYIWASTVRSETPRISAISLFFYATRLVGEEEAEDVVQDVFVELWKRKDHIEIGDQIQAFLYRAVYTRALNVLKHRSAL